jgi:L(+)-tartrate dehydratase alpha subunit
MDKELARNRIADTMEKFLRLGAVRLPDDVYKKLKECEEKETSEMQKVLYKSYFDNLDTAFKKNRPCCQDTGLLHFYIEVGTEFPYMDILEDALREATINATQSVPLRQNTVNYFEEKNTGNNVGERIPWIHWDIVPGGDNLEIIQYFAGGGCVLPGCAKVFKPSDGYEAIVEYVFDAVSDLGINACPPLIVGVGLGHNIENAALLSKKAYLRPIGTSHHHERGKELEEALLEGLNNLGIGAQGMKGNSVAMAVNIESSARHTATIAVAVNVACYAHRRGVIKFYKDLSYEIMNYEGADIS